MDKNFAPEKYGMAICPLCNGKGFLIKGSDQIHVALRRPCTKCGGFGAIKKEEVTDLKLGKSESDRENEIGLN